MFDSRRLYRLVLPLGLSAMVASGCALEELFTGKSTSTVNLFTTHGGTPTPPSDFPDYGAVGNTRTFTNDQGWEISIYQAYVTTAEVRLQPCGGPSPIPVEMFWGPCAEDFIVIEDAVTIPLGAVTVDDGEYCGVDVVFAPYVVSPQAEEHAIPDNSEVEGNTIYIVGLATRGQDEDLEEVPFEVITPKGTMVSLDLSTFDNGKPLRLDDEDFPRSVTIVKTYDTFFEGIDFATATPMDLEASVLAALEQDTLVFDGSSI